MPGDQAPGTQNNTESFTDKERFDALNRVISMFRVGDEESSESRARIIADMEEEKRNLVKRMKNSVL
jgi:site-specific recombinase